MKRSNIINGQSVQGSGRYFTSINPATLSENSIAFEIATLSNVDQAVEEANKAFSTYKDTTGKQKAAFLRAIAHEIEAIGDDLLEMASSESGLPIARFKGERGRTCGQLRSFADLLEEGSWVEATIDEAVPDRKPMPRVDIRKMLHPIGPVVVFGASNFPLAFSTAGGDTASALAAGCPVIVKAHPSHPGTNAMVSEAIVKALRSCSLPLGIFSTLYDDGYTIGKALVQHPGIFAVGFTGSEAGGKALMNFAAQREVPIPVYAEMGSTNPVFIFPDKMRKEIESLPLQLADSVNMGVGQFCTNPGLLIVQENDQLDDFSSNLEKAFSSLKAFTMLNKGIYSNYIQKREAALQAPGVQSIQVQDATPETIKAPPAIARVNYADFQKNPNLHQEIFGPFTLMVICKSSDEMNQLAKQLSGQLTATLMGTDQDLTHNTSLINTLKDKVGRIVFNGVPTGVEVVHAMHHGGPFPAASNGRYTSVGTSAIIRFARPVAWQNCPDSLLPEALKQKNPLGIWRKINGEMTKS